MAYGENDLVKIFERKQYAEVEAFYQHPEFSIDDTPNDIALIRLKQPLNFSQAVQPACLPTEHRERYDGVLKVRHSACHTVYCFNQFN